ncbi:hypothetical protein A4X13_0g4113 [Tilletia indica]|uniref:Uncharacterized protein n=1 Tax=Tilletia indica TaxID=43049 RepID=A0A177TAL6_9BASI|nr:hypothetical protein A4X13_0g4113 [Tilletia indica]
MPPVRTVPGGSNSSSSAGGPSRRQSTSATSRNEGPLGGSGGGSGGISTSASSSSNDIIIASMSSSIASPPEGTSMPAPGELKPQKACVGCRRSKVKCIHDGGPPCRRCSESGQECKFRLRADDERWRERTDETLSKLSQAVDRLISTGLPGPSSAVMGGPGREHGRGTSAGEGSSFHTNPLRQPPTFPASSSYSDGPPSSSHLPPFATSRSSSFHDRHHSISGASPPGHVTSPADAAFVHPVAGPSTPSERSASMSGPMGAQSSSSTSYHLGRSPGPYAFGPLHALTSSAGGREGDDARMTDVVPTSNGSHGRPNGGTTTPYSGSSGPNGRSSSMSSMLPPPLPLSAPPAPGGITSAPYALGQRIPAPSPLPMPPALIPGLDTMSASGPTATAGASSSSAPSAGGALSQQQVAVPPPVPIDPDQTLPSSLLLQVGAEAASFMAATSGGSTGVGGPSSLLGMPFDGGSGGGPGSGAGRGSALNVRGSGSGSLGMGGWQGGGGIRWQVGPPSPYASPAIHLGRDDPRLNAMSLGLIPMEKARALFVFFSEWLQPHSFGFPSYAASEQMTPLIISCILTVGSLFDPTGQTAGYYANLRDDALNFIKVEQVIDGPDMFLNPELGIGVEEITGAAIASAWLGGEIAWKIARTVRWWALGYLRHFELPSRNVTVGEYLTILPPFRQIDLCDKLRIWLMAYVAETQQCFLFDRPSLASDQSSPQAYCSALRAAFRDTEPAFAVPAPDRQLMAHAGILAILVEAQTVQRERRWERDAKAQLSAQFQQQQQQQQHQFHGHHPQQQRGGGGGGGGGHSNGHGSDSGETPGSAGGSQGAMMSPQSPNTAQEVVQGLRNLVAFGREWIEHVERWMVAARKLEDLSSCTGISLDITLMYHLSRAWLGSSALEATRVLNSLTMVHGDKARSITQGLDSLFDVVEHQVIRSARDGAVRALQLASNRTEGFADRLAYLPSIYHFLLSHAASFVLLLVQRHRRWRYLVSGEAADLIRVAEDFVQAYTYAIQAHGVNNEDHAGVRHPSRATCNALLRALQQAKASI